MRLRSAIGSKRSQGCWARPGWLGVVLAGCLAWVASAQAQPFVYVAGQSGSVSQFDAIGGPLVPLTPPLVASGPPRSTPTGVAVSPDGKSVYVANQFDDSVSQYNVGADGTLSPKVPAKVTADKQPVSVAVSPDGKSVYTANFAGIPRVPGTVSQYDVGAGGALTLKMPATVAAGVGTTDVAVSPDGKSVYVTNESDALFQYDVGPTGALTPKTPPTVSGAGGGFELVVSPNGEQVYVSVLNLGVVPLDVGAGGLLTAGQAPVFVQDSAGIAISPDGKSLYVTETTPAQGAVAQFDVGADGALSPKTPATVPTGTGDSAPIGIAVAPDGKSVYVANSSEDSVSQYSVGAGGALSPKTPATVSTDSRPGFNSDPVRIAVSPLPAVHATATSVSCSSRMFAPGDATVCKATVTDTTASGQTTPTGTVSFSNSGGGSVFGSPCTLSGSGASASCTVFFASFARGGHIVAAAYGGDATHSASRGFTGVTVAVPGSTAGCVVFGHGRITAADGDKASFRGLVAALPPRGVEFYRDHGPANPVRVASTSVDALTCTDDATKARVFGTAKVNGGSLVQYRIDVQLTAWERGTDSYRIRLGNGYDSGAQLIRHGDLDIHLHDRDHQHHDANADRIRSSRRVIGCLRMRLDRCG